MFLAWDHCYLGSFKVLWTFLHMYFGRQKHSYLLGICPRMKILYHRVCEYWILGNMDSFPIILHHPCVRVPVAPHPCENLVLSAVILTLAIWHGYNDTTLWFFTCISLISNVGAFLYIYWTFPYLFCKVPFQVFAQIFLKFSFSYWYAEVLYTFYVTFCHVCVLQIFSNLWYAFFTFLMVSCDESKYLLLITFDFLIFYC